MIPEESLEPYTFKGEPDLREVLRRIAYEQTTTYSAWVNALIMANPLVIKYLAEVKKNKKTA